MSPGNTASLPSDMTGGHAGPSYGLKQPSIPFAAPLLAFELGYVSVAVPPVAARLSNCPVVDTASTSTNASAALLRVCTRTRYGAPERGDCDGDAGRAVTVGVVDAATDDDGVADGEAPADSDGDGEPVPLGVAGAALGVAVAVAGTHSA